MLWVGLWQIHSSLPFTKASTILSSSYCAIGEEERKFKGIMRRRREIPFWRKGDAIDSGMKGNGGCW